MSTTHEGHPGPPCAPPRGLGSPHTTSSSTQHPNPALGSGGCSSAPTTGGVLTAPAFWGGSPSRPHPRTALLGKELKPPHQPRQAGPAVRPQPHSPSPHMLCGTPPLQLGSSRGGSGITLPTPSMTRGAVGGKQRARRRPPGVSEGCSGGAPEALGRQRPPRSPSGRTAAGRGGPSPHAPPTPNSHRFSPRLTGGRAPQPPRSPSQARRCAAVSGTGADPPAPGGAAPSSPRQPPMGAPRGRAAAAGGGGAGARSCGAGSFL